MNGKSDLRARLVPGAQGDSQTRRITRVEACRNCGALIPAFPADAFPQESGSFQLTRLIPEPVDGDIPDGEIGWEKVKDTVHNPQRSGRMIDRIGLEHAARPGLRAGK